VARSAAVLCGEPAKRAKCCSAVAPTCGQHGRAAQITLWAIGKQERFLFSLQIHPPRGMQAGRRWREHQDHDSSTLQYHRAFPVGTGDEYCRHTVAHRMSKVLDAFLGRHCLLNAQIRRCGLLSFDAVCATGVLLYLPISLT
jgi:hypothetical protein